MAHPPPSARIRLAVGTSIAAIAGVAAFAVASASTPPAEPASPEAVVDAVLASAEADGLPLDRDCVSEIVAKVPPGELAAVLAEMQSEAASANDVAAADTLPVLSIPELSMPEIDIPTISMPDIDIPGVSLPEIEMPSMSMPDVEMPSMSMPEVPVATMSDETRELGQQLVYCVAGDADPALVDQALAALEGEDEIDLECAAAVLTAFDDATLQAVIDNAGQDMTSASLPPEQQEQASLLFACANLGAPAATGPASAAPETVPG